MTPEIFQIVKSNSLKTLARSAALLALCCGLVRASLAAETRPARDKVVLLISLGGLPPSELQDTNISAPTLRRLASEGASASRMGSEDPTITWPNHSTMISGVAPKDNGVLYNGLVVRPGPRLPVLVEPCPRSAILHAPTLYDLAHQAGFTTAQVSWPPSDDGPNIDWTFGELSNSTGPLERELLQAGLLTAADLQEVPVTVSMRRDDIWCRALNYIVTQHHPNLLLLRLTDFDGVTHKHGLGSPESGAAVSAADARINQILDLLKKTGSLDRVTIFIVSDQGFKPVRRHIRPNAALRKAGLLTVAGPKVLSKVVAADACALTAGGIAQVFLTNPERREETRAQVKQLFSGMEGIERVIEPAEYARWGFPKATKDGQMGDFVLLAKGGYGFIAKADGEPVTDVAEGTTVAFHGYRSSDPDMDAIFMAWGQGIRPGARVGKISNLDVAPTVARVLGLKFEHVDGRVLNEILK
jgi:predicted AlkP superfamily pyrophosphatase or phosphodiesterase